MDQIIPDSIDIDIDILMRDIERGLLVPVLGGDINLCGRPATTDTTTIWKDLNYAPTTWEIALHLLKEARHFKIFSDDEDLQNLADILITQLNSPQDSMSPICLANVCQYMQVFHPAILEGIVPRILSEKYRPTPVHDFLVKLAQYEADPAIADAPYPCIVTACFDQVLEQQLRDNNVPFHLVAFVLGENGVVFEYTPPGQDPSRSSKEMNLENQENVTKLQEELKKHAVIIKLNGGILAGRRDFPITEDHYIDYISHQGIKDKLLEMLLAKLTKRGKKGSPHLLFLGYSPRHLNLRVILRRVWSESLKNPNKRWTVIMERRFSKIDKKFWLEYGVKESDLRQIDSLEIYIRKILDCMARLPRGDAAVSAGSSPIEPAPSRPVRDGIFISYSHQDDEWRQELTNMLAPARASLKIWDDTKIRPGARWKEEIENALASAKAAVLLVSPDFLKSEFIEKNELPPLLEAAQKGGCRILWIKVKESLVDYTPIGQYQALYSKKPLADLKKAERGEALLQIATKILKETDPATK